MKLQCYQFAESKIDIDFRYYSKNFVQVGHETIYALVRPTKIINDLHKTSTRRSLIGLKMTLHLQDAYVVSCPACKKYFQWYLINILTFYKSYSFSEMFENSLAIVVTIWDFAVLRLEMLWIQVKLGAIHILRQHFFGLFPTHTSGMSV